MTSHGLAEVGGVATLADEAAAVSLLRRERGDDKPGTYGVVAKSPPLSPVRCIDDIKQRLTAMTDRYGSQRKVSS